MNKIENVPVLIEPILQWEEEDKGPNEQKRLSYTGINTLEKLKQGSEKELAGLGGGMT